MGIYQDRVKRRHYYLLISGILESEISELGFHQGLRKMNRILFIFRAVFHRNLQGFSQILIQELDPYEWGIYQDSVRRRHYSQFISGTLESEIGELGFFKVLER